MILKNIEIPFEFERINGFVLEELEKEIQTTDFIVEDLNEYLRYLDERYKRGEPAHRPEWVTQYINLPSDVILW